MTSLWLVDAVWPIQIVIIVWKIVALKNTFTLPFFFSSGTNKGLRVCVRVCYFLLDHSHLHTYVCTAAYIWRIGRHIVFDMCMFLMSSGRLLENNFLSVVVNVFAFFFAPSAIAVPLSIWLFDSVRFGLSLSFCRCYCCYCCSCFSCYCCFRPNCDHGIHFVDVVIN